MTPRLILNDLQLTTKEGQTCPKLSLTMMQGEVVALVGASGVGKSSVLRACLGLLPEAFRVSGTCEVLDGVIKVNLLTAAAKVRVRVLVGWPQEAAAALDPSWSVIDVVRSAARDAGQTETSASAALRAVDFPFHRDHATVRDLSGGEARRAGIAAVIATNAPCVLLDEPTAGLSESGIEALAAVIRRHQASGGSWLIATHDLAFARRIGARVVSMDAGGMGGATPHPRTLTHNGAARPLLVASAVSFARGGRPVLSESSMTLVEGRVASLTGPSGAGKSTLCRILCGELAPLTGNVTLSGRLHVAPGEFPRGSERRRVHYTRQDARLALDPWRTAESLLRDAAGAASSGGWRTAAERASFPTDLFARRPGALSGGERQRLLLARGYAAEPSVMLVDEALTGLDATLREAVIEGLVVWASEGERSVLLVTHDQGLVSARGWSGWQLVEGRLSPVGSAC